MKPVRDFDSVDRAQALQTAAWAAFGGVIFGFAGALKFGLPGFIIGWLAGAALIALVALHLADRAGRAAGTLYHTRGSSTPARPDYSLGDAHAARGRYDDAAAEFQRCADLFADDPEPRLRLARLLRDRMHRLEHAAQCFRHVLQLPGLEPGIEALATRELTELYTAKLQQPERALPLLARLAERQATTPAGQWAGQLLQELRQQSRDGSAPDGP